MLPDAFGLEDDQEQRNKTPQHALRSDACIFFVIINNFLKDDKTLLIETDKIISACLIL